MDNDMIYKKIIPCLDLNNAVDMAKYYNDAGLAAGLRLVAKVSLVYI